MTRPLERRWFVTLFSAAAVGTCAAGVAFAQSAPPTRDANEEVRGEAGVSTESLRQIVDRQLERSRRMTAALEEARAMLDRGEPADAVRRKLRESIAEGPGWGRRSGADLGDDADEAIRSFERGRRAGAEGGWPGLFGPGLPHRGGGSLERRPEGPDNDSESPLDAARVDEIMKFIEKNRPEMAQRLRALRERDPEAVRVFMRDKGRQILRIMREEAEQPELWRARRAVADAEHASYRAAVDARRAEGEAKRLAEDRLRDALRAQFDARVALAQQEIADARARVERLARQLEESVNKRDTFLEERLQRALAGEELTHAPPFPGGPGGTPRQGPKGPGKDREPKRER